MSSTNKENRSAAMRQPLGMRQPLQAINHNAAAPAAALAVKEYELGYDPAVIVHNGSEQCFEEARARAWVKKRTLVQTQQPPRRFSVAQSQPQAPAAAGSGSRQQPQTAAPTTPQSSRLPSRPSVRTPQQQPQRVSFKPATPTFFTRAAMDDVDAMFKDSTGNLTATLQGSLVADLDAALQSSPEPSNRGHRQTRASPIPSLSFEIHPDTGLIPSRENYDDEDDGDGGYTVPAMQSLGFSIREDTQFIDGPSYSQSSVPVYDDAANTVTGANNDDDDELIDIKSKRFTSLRPSFHQQLTERNDRDSFASFACTSVAPTAVSYEALLLTPILETSRESDASNLTHLSLRSISSSARSSATGSFSLTGSIASIRTSTNTSTQSHSVQHANHNQSLSFAEYQSRSIEQSHFLSNDCVTVLDSAAPFTVVELASGRVTDVEFGDTWLRIEKRLTDSSSGMPRFVANDIDNGRDVVTNIYSPASLWSHYVSTLIETRLTTDSAAIANSERLSTTKQLLLTHCLVLHSYHFADNVSLTLMQHVPHQTLATILAMHSGNGSAMDDTLVAHYTSEVLRLISVLYSVGVQHRALTGDVIQCIGENHDTVIVQSFDRAIDTQSTLTVADIDATTSDRQSVVRLMLAMMGLSPSLTMADMSSKLTRLQQSVFLPVVRSLLMDTVNEPVSLLAQLAEHLQAWLIGDSARVKQLRMSLCKQTVMLSAA